MPGAVTARVRYRVDEPDLVDWGMPEDPRAADRRPDPDALIALAAAEHRGRLKIFLGAAPGVGKTWEMLAQAKRQQAQGVDVLAGVVETHGRAGTIGMLDGLPPLPLRAIPYRGQMLQEFDLDAALARRPGLLLVDELAHTNAPGSRHAKRWEDVAELVKAGLTVWATLNVQHLESLNDDVARITGVRVSETLPDRVLEMADEIELIDLPPAELRARLADGQIYRADNAKRALDGFFKEGNLASLREMALRRAAAHVDEDVRNWMARSGGHRAVAIQRAGAGADRSGCVGRCGGAAGQATGRCAACAVDGPACGAWRVDAGGALGDGPGGAARGQCGHAGGCGPARHGAGCGAAGPRDASGGGPRPGGAVAAADGADFGG